MSELRTLWIPLSVAALAVLVLLVDVMTPPTTGKQMNGRGMGWFVAAGLSGIFVATFFVDGSGTAAYGAYRGGAWAVFLQRLFLIAGCLGTLGGIEHSAKYTSRRQGEYWLLLLFCLVGMVLLPGARSLVLLIVCFELMSVPLYVLAAYGKTDASGAPEADAPRTRASEAALKLYLVGATSTAVTMFGLALVTGMTGTTDLARIGAAPVTPLSGLGMVFVLAGLGYKIGMVPFHMWVPDTYQGAATPFVAFLSVAPKAAGISVLSSIFVFGLAAHREVWMPPLAFMAFLSMGVGNLLALPQTDLRRLLGYSGIAQMGYVLVALVAGDAFGMAMVLFFLAAYVFTNLGTFLVVHAAAGTSGNYRFESLYGLAKRAPGLAVALLFFLLSLAGIPFVVGFWAKLYVFLAAWRAGFVWLVAGGIALAVLGLFYYLRMLRAAYLVDSDDLAAPKPDVSLQLAIVLCLVAVVGLGLWPRSVLDSATRAGNDLVGQVRVSPTGPAESPANPADTRSSR